MSAVDAHADVQAGICGFHTQVAAHGGGGYSVSFDMVTDCGTIASLAAELTEHGPFNALEEIDPRTPSGLLAVVSAHLKGCCAGCAVPVGLFKAMQVAAGLALPKDVEIGLSADRTTRAEQSTNFSTKGDEMSDGARSPMEILRATVPEGARTYLEHKASIMETPELQAVPAKYKLLVGIGVAAALQSSTCTLMWSKLAKQAGATQAEIAEAILVSRLMKMATVNDTAAEALAWLEENEG